MTALLALGLVTAGVASAGAAPAPAPAAPTPAIGNQKVVVHYDSNSAAVSFAAGELCAELRKIGVEVSTASLADAGGPAGAWHVVLGTSGDVAARAWSGSAGRFLATTTTHESYAISASDGQPGRVIGSDQTGTMYGVLHLAEIIRLDKVLPKKLAMYGEAAIARRGVKFNIPLDARTPSYDDTGDAAQANIANMWDFEFWRAYLDDMARARYNTLTLWNPHPFPSMVKCPDFPDVALADVCVTTAPIDHRTDREWGNRKHMLPENLKVVRKMTIDEKIDFWRRVMAHAKGRGIDVYIITWNVFVDGTDGKYGIDDKQDNLKTIAYMRQCVDRLIRTYPLLKGIGTTAGEHMQNRKDEFAKEKWLWATYGLGIVDAKKADPDRKVPFIHRVWQTDVGPIVDDFASKYPDTVELSFKYAKAHMYSSTRPPFAADLVRQLAERKMRCWWNLRNDDIFVFRWGGPGYVRKFLDNFPADVSAGYYVGSDGYVWGRTFNDVDPARRGRMEIEKHWYSFMLWGRLGYNPQLFPYYRQALLAEKFSIQRNQAAALDEAWNYASAIIPWVNRFHWRDWDFMWAVEGCMDAGKGFHTVEDFIATKPMEGQRIISIPEHLEDPNRWAHSEMMWWTPPIVASELADCAARARNGAASVRKAGPVTNVELAETLADIEAMAHLGDYYADKILAATDLAMFRKTKDPKHKASAVAHLEKAATACQAYADNASKRYLPQLLARTRVLDFQALAGEAKKDIDIARQAE
jgi:hypothetical protein